MRPKPERVRSLDEGPIHFFDSAALGDRWLAIRDQPYIVSCVGDDR